MENKIVVEVLYRASEENEALFAKVAVLEYDLGNMVLVQMIDVDAHPECVEKYNLQSTPEINIWKGGQIVSSFSGVPPYVFLQDTIETKFFEE